MSLLIKSNDHPTRTPTKKIYKNDRNWKTLVRDLKEFLSGKGAIKKEPLKPFDKNKLKLITLDFIS